MAHLTAHMWLTVVAGAVILVVAATLLVHAAVHSLQRTRVLYRAHFDDPHRERLFLASLGFFLTVLFVRTLTLAIHFRIGGLHDIAVAGTHVHHLVWGILLLLLVGYLWLAQLGIGAGARWMSRLTALLYGVGAALTLDEFALLAPSPGCLLEPPGAREHRGDDSVWRTALHGSLGWSLFQCHPPRCDGHRALAVMRSPGSVERRRRPGGVGGQ
jgi:hypothetical protein